MGDIVTKGVRENGKQFDLLRQMYLAARRLDYDPDGREGYVWIMSEHCNVIPFFNEYIADRSDSHMVPAYIYGIPVEIDNKMSDGCVILGRKLW